MFYNNEKINAVAEAVKKIMEVPEVVKPVVQQTAHVPFTPLEEDMHKPLLPKQKQIQKDIDRKSKRQMPSKVQAGTLAAHPIRAAQMRYDAKNKMKKEESEQVDEEQEEHVLIHVPGNIHHGKKARVFYKHPDGRINVQLRHSQKKGDIDNFTLKPGNFKPIKEEAEQVDEANYTNIPSVVSNKVASGMTRAMHKAAAKRYEADADGAHKEGNMRKRDWANDMAKNHHQAAKEMESVKEEKTFKDRLIEGMKQKENPEELLPDLEEEMSDSQKKKREEIVMSMKDKTSYFKKKYGAKWKNVMYATATKQAMGEQIIWDDYIYDRVVEAKGHDDEEEDEKLFDKEMKSHNADADSHKPAIKKMVKKDCLKSEEVEQIEEGLMTGITLGKKVKNDEGGHDQVVHHKGKKIGTISSYSHRTGTRYGMTHDASNDATAGSRSHEEALGDLRYSHAEHLKSMKNEEVERHIPVKEEVEQVDEISTKLANRYFSKAGKQSQKPGAKNRDAGMAMAYKKVQGRHANVPTTEEVMFESPDQDIDDEDITTDMLRGRVAGGKVNSFKNFKVKLKSDREYPRAPDDKDSIPASTAARASITAKKWDPPSNVKTEEVDHIDEAKLPPLHKRTGNQQIAHDLGLDQEYSKKYPGGEKQRAKDNAAFLKRFPPPKNEEVEQVDEKKKSHMLVVPKKPDPKTGRKDVKKIPSHMWAQMKDTHYQAEEVDLEEGKDPSMDAGVGSEASFVQNANTSSNPSPKHTAISYAKNLAHKAMQKIKADLGHK